MLYMFGCYFRRRRSLPLELCPTKVAKLSGYFMMLSSQQASFQPQQVNLGKFLEIVGECGSKFKIV